MITPDLPPTTRITQLKSVAQDLEASFLSQMLKEAGFGKTPDVFGGDVGEDQFSSFLVEAHAREIVKAGGIGLADQIFNYLVAQEAENV